MLNTFGYLALAAVLYVECQNFLSVPTFRKAAERCCEIQQETFTQLFR